jgi:hypothetical protein
LIFTPGIGKPEPVSLTTPPTSNPWAKPKRIEIEKD